MLTLITTPIGNLNDMSPRAITAIEQADIWLVKIHASQQSLSAF